MYKRNDRARLPQSSQQNPSYGPTSSFLGSSGLAVLLRVSDLSSWTSRLFLGMLEVRWARGGNVLALIAHSVCADHQFTMHGRIYIHYICTGLKSALATVNIRTCPIEPFSGPHSRALARFISFYNKGKKHILFHLLLLTTAYL
jgi:hypothetical protein